MNKLANEIISLQHVKSEANSVLLLGRHNSGKTSTALSYALDKINSQTCIYFTSEKKDLIKDKIFNSDNHVSKSNLDNILVLEAKEVNLNGAKIDDHILTKQILGIIQPIEKLKPEKIVFDEITPFLNFEDLDLMKKVFNKVFRYLNYCNIKSLFTLSDPFSPRAKLIVEIIKNEFSINLKIS